MSDKEKAYLETELGNTNEVTGGQKVVPWKKLLSSPAVIALIVAQIGHNWGFFIMVTDLPKYMNDVLKFSIKENGVYSSLPYITMFIAAQLTAFVTDWLIIKKYVSITNIRKFCTAIGMYDAHFVIVNIIKEYLSSCYRSRCIHPGRFVFRM